MTTLLIFFSTILYSYISYSVNKQLEESIIKHANYLFATYPNIEQMVKTQKEVIKETLNVEVEIGKLPSSIPFLTSLRRYNELSHDYIELRIPYKTNKITKEHQYLSIKGNVTQQLKVKAQVYQGIIFISIITMGIIIIYAFFISNMLTTPIKILTSNLSKMDETTIKTINTNNLPTEFRPLAKTINSLFMRIQNFIKYKKELFIGSAHELKTPLAVMKTKNQVTLMKKNSTKDDLIEAIKQ
ncbi:MAG: sensor histidine kinase, partial [Nitrososphaeraceae archaeon]